MSPQPLFAHNLIAAGVLGLAIVGFVYSEWWIGRRGAFAGVGSRHANRSGPAVALGLFAVYIAGPALAVVATATVVTDHQVTVFVIGLTIAALGQSLRLWAVGHLGTSFSFAIRTVEDQRVIDTGPYRLVRHPSYTGALLCALGFTVAYTNWLAPVVVSPLAIAYVFRIPDEERALSAGLGEPYREYMSRTKRLVPFVF